MAEKPIQENTIFSGSDPVYMNLEDDGQEEFDNLWLNAKLLPNDRRTFWASRIRSLLGY